MAIYNFSAGPAALPKPVLQKAQTELLDWNNLGTSVMEVSHRSKPFMAVAEKLKLIFALYLMFPATIRCCLCRAVVEDSFSRYRLICEKR